jgi:manganese/zinc/iron transport system ATP- binding protein
MIEEEYALRIDDLTVAYHQSPVLWDVDFYLPQGKIAALVGPNGAGKSTLIKTVMELIRPVAGQVRIFGQSFRRMRQRVAYVPQRASVDWDFPTTVFDVVLMGTYGRLGWFRRPEKKEREEVWEALGQVGMEDFAHRQISQLSGGQQQRTFLARALVQKGELVLMDEPFQGVDARTEEAIVKVFGNLRSKGATLLVVHHDLKTVPKYFDHIALLNREMIAQGSVEETFTHDLVEKTYGGLPDSLVGDLAPAAGPDREQV